jgi:hypothetical protein
MPRTKRAVQEPEASTGQNGQPGEMPASKMDAVRRALGVLGRKASPSEIQEFVKDSWGIEMSAKMASVYKSKTRKGGKRGRPGRKPKGESAVTAAAPRGAALGVSFRDLRTIKDLSERLGHSRLQELVEIMAK